MSGTNETITIEAVVRDVASGALEGLNSKLTTLGSKVKALNDLGASTNGSGGWLSKMKTGVMSLGNQVVTLGEKFDVLAEKMGEKVKHAAETGLKAFTALGVGVSAMAIDIQKEIDNANVTLTAFLGGPAAAGNTPQKMIDQMRNNTWLVDLNTQVAGAKQFMTNPMYRNQAMQINQSLVDISAASGPNASQSYTQLSNMLSRALNMGRINGRVQYLLAQSGLSMSDFAQMVGLPDPNSSAEAAQLFQKTVGQIATPQQLINFINAKAKSPQFAQASSMYASTLSGAMAMAKMDISNQVHDTLGQGGAQSVASQLSQLVAPTNKQGQVIQGQGLAGLVATLAGTVIPPIMQVLSAIVAMANKLMPFVAPLVQILGNTLAKAFQAMIPALQPLAKFGPQLAKALGDAMNKLIPLIPAFLPLFITLLGLLPNAIRMLTPFLQLLDMILIPLTKILNTVITKFPGVQTALSGVLGAILAMMVVSKVTKVLQGLYQSLLQFLGIKGKPGSESQQSTSQLISAMDANTQEIVAAINRICLCAGGKGPGGGGGGGGESPIVVPPGGGIRVPELPPVGRPPALPPGTEFPALPPGGGPLYPDAITVGEVSTETAGLGALGASIVGSGITAAGALAGWGIWNGITAPNRKVTAADVVSDPAYATMLSHGESVKQIVDFLNSPQGKGPAVNLAKLKVPTPAQMAGFGQVDWSKVAAAAQGIHVHGDIIVQGAPDPVATAKAVVATTTKQAKRAEVRGAPNPAVGANVGSYFRINQGRKT